MEASDFIVGKTGWRGALFASTVERRLAATAALLWLLMTAPAVLFSQWFPLDLPAIYHMGRHLDDWLQWILSPYNGSGRYFPVYWLYNVLQYFLFGSAVGPYFLVQSLMFLVAAVMTCWLLQRLTDSRPAALLLFIAIYLSSPLAENLSTLGKAEPLSYLLVVCVLATFHQAATRRIGWKAAAPFISVVFALAVWTKETSLILFGFALTGCVASLLAHQIPSWKQQSLLKPYVNLTLSLLAGWLITKAPYFVFLQKVKAKTYTDYEITVELVLDNVRFYLEQQPDVVIFGCLAMVLVLMAARSAATRRVTTGPLSPDKLVFVFSLCAMAWAYWLAMQIWRWPMAYYMLLPAVIFKFCAMYGLYALHSADLLRPLAVKSIAAVMGVALLYAALAIHYIVASQIGYSRIYTQAMHAVKQHVPTGSRLILENYPFFAEQIGGTQMLADNQLSRAFDVRGIGELMDPAVLKPDLLKVLEIRDSDLEKNMESIPRKGDYLLSFTGLKMAHWFLRGVAPYHSLESQLKANGAYTDMPLLAGARSSVAAPYVHVWTNLPAFSTTWVGYELYRIEDEVPRFFWRGRFPDGWVGARSSVIVNPSYGEAVRLAISVPPYTLPATVRVWKDGELFREMAMTGINEVYLEVGTLSKSITLTFEVSKTFVGRRLGLNRDERKLGARIAFVPPTGRQTP